jgi:Mechanosensitive ion channel, conserved TM helix
MSDILAVDIGDTVSNTVERSVNIGLKLLIFALILLVGWLISRALYRLADRLLDRVGFNRVAERSGLRRWTGQYRPSDLVAKIVYYGLLLLTLQLAFGVFGPNPISDMINAVVAWLPMLIVACVIIVVAAAIASAVFDVIDNALSGLSYGRTLARSVQVLIIALGVIAALNQIGVATSVTLPVLITVLATLGGIAIVGIGGGLVRPMTQRWERALNRVEAESTRAAAQVRDNAQRRATAATFGQPAYQARPGQAAAADVQRAAEQAGQQARSAVQRAQQAGVQQGGAQPGGAQPGGTQR